jgi:hypothetical protein
MFQGDGRDVIDGLGMLQAFFQSEQALADSGREGGGRGGGCFQLEERDQNV